MLVCANHFFESVDLDLAWSQLFASVSQSPPETSVLDVLLFVQEKLALCDNDSKRLHLPLFLFLLADLVTKVSSDFATVITRFLGFTLELLSRTSPRSIY